MTLLTNILVGVWLLLIWVMICNILTGNDRHAIIDQIFREPNWRELNRSFNQISYDRHLWYRVSFRNPRKLYPINVQEAMGWKPRMVSIKVSSESERIRIVFDRAEWIGFWTHRTGWIHEKANPKTIWGDLNCLAEQKNPHLLTMHTFDAGITHVSINHDD